MDEQNVSNVNFKLWTKWFWIGIAVAFTSASPVTGLIYGVALALEKDHRKEGAIIIVFTIVWFVVAAYWLGPLLVSKGILPQYQLIK